MWNSSVFTPLQSNTPLLIQNLSTFLRLEWREESGIRGCWNIAFLALPFRWLRPWLYIIYIKLYLNSIDFTTWHTSIINWLFGYCKFVRPNICIQKTSTHMIFCFVNKFDVINRWRQIYRLNVAGDNLWVVHTKNLLL